MGYDIENFHYKWKNQESLGIFILTFSKYALEMMEVFITRKQLPICEILNSATFDMFFEKIVVYLILQK
jgi:hypothetical protein